MIFNFLEGQGMLSGLGGISLGFSALYGPLIYLYIKSLQRSNYTIERLKILHFLPSLLLVLMALSFPDLQINFFGLIVIVGVYIYLIAGILSVKHYQKIIKQTQSRYDGIALKW